MNSLFLFGKRHSQHWCRRIAVNCENMKHRGCKVDRCNLHCKNFIGEEDKGKSHLKFAAFYSIANFTFHYVQCMNGQTIQHFIEVLKAIDMLDEMLPCFLSSAISTQRR